VHRKELLSQWKESIRKYIGVEATVFTDKKEEKQFGEITVAMVTSLNNWLKVKGNKIPQFEVLIVDEAHHTPSDTFYKVSMGCDARYRIGLTATTEREDGSDLYMVAALGEVKHVVSAEELIGDKLLAKPVFEFIDLPPTFGRLGGEFAAIYKAGIVLNNDRNQVIVSRARQLASEGRQVYVHVEHISHGELLSKMSGYPFCYSGTKERDDIIQNFRNGETRVLISTLLGEGVDFPKLGAIIMAGGRKTKIGTIQKVGRALRPDGDKEAIIVDFIDKGKYISTHTRERYEAYVEVFGDYVSRFKRKIPNGDTN
jgi:superfamily II DNA or RNA helicase